MPPPSKHTQRGGGGGGELSVEKGTNWVRSLPLITYAPMGRRGGVKHVIHFYCVLYEKRKGERGSNSM